ncbi:regulator of protease activity HflC (stomatin/prohibitin superfamily) [Thermonema lapsum]|uniref:Regulator of protease activity HflC (Stomatin/prohibitin superfamily) n=1 Tax=Thermonema lapsum TaxID=28195 RepID=A0A846MS30_9BACT|nr:prohibitin family protein [Thermonema lapsum]NIK74067.1 regulator of protease activity HflC (stomatin/prohibitin superfamily) [Thermonema lapsum]
MKPKSVISIIGVVIVGIILLVLVTNTFVQIESGTVGVVKKLGAVESEVLQEGLHLINPFTTDVIIMDARVQKYEVNATASSRDLQPITARVAVNFYIDKEAASKIYRELGLGYLSTIIDPTIQESMKSATSHYTAEELITKRPEIKQVAFDYVRERLGKNHIIVTDFSIIDFAFSPEFTHAIEQKQIAEQEALAEKNRLERVKMQAQQEIERARAQAEAQRLLQQSIDDKVLTLRFLEKWNGELPIVMGSNDGAFLDVTQFARTKRK